MFLDFIAKQILYRYLPRHIADRLWPFVQALLKLQQMGEVSLTDIVGEYEVTLQVRKRR